MSGWGIVVLIAGLLVGVSAAFCLVQTFTESFMWVFGAVVLAIISGLLITWASHTHSPPTSKHEAILHDYRAEGFDIVSSQVFADGNELGNWTEVDLHIGPCQFPTIARKIESKDHPQGRWYPGILDWNGHGVHVLTPKDLPLLAKVCA